MEDSEMPALTSSEKRLSIPAEDSLYFSTRSASHMPFLISLSIALAFNHLIEPIDDSFRKRLARPLCRQIILFDEDRIVHPRADVLQNLPGIY